MKQSDAGPPINRREMLTRSGVGLGMLGLASILADGGDLMAAPPAEGLLDPLALKPPHFPGRAKRVVHFFLNGGPSAVDTFDPKPLLEKYAGQPLPKTYVVEKRTVGGAFPSPFKFQKYGQCGTEVSELFARTAEHVDDIAVIRSMYTQIPNHEPAFMLMNCGDAVQPRPSVGSWVLYGLGAENQSLPGFIAMCPKGYPLSDKGNWKSGFLPGAYQGTYIDSQYRDVDKLIENIRSPHATTAFQRQQLELLRALSAEHQATRHDPRLDARVQSFELAFRMQMQAAEAFSIADEPKHIQDLYGDTIHGRQTLIARRLLERGVRYVQLWHGADMPWDHHGDIVEHIPERAGEIDQPISALLTDLKQRGMLEDTLVIWGGEFGRTPTSEASTQAKPGRNHNHVGFTVWMAGGGVRGGMVHGATDEFGFKAVEEPVSIHDFHATILHLLGLDHERLTYRYAGRDFRLTDVSGRVVKAILA